MDTAIAIPEPKSSGLNKTDRLVIRIAAYTVGSALIGTGLYWLGKRAYKNVRQKNSASKTLTIDTPQNYAARIYKALFDGWWADAQAIRQIFLEIPSQQFFQQVAKEYESVNKEGRNQLYLDLKKKLTDQEYIEMTNILSSKPALPGQKAVFDMKAAQAMARRIKSAFDYTWLGMDGTNKPALKEALLDIPSLYGFAMVKVAYKNLYHTNIEDDLDSELDVFDFSWKDIVYTKPKR